MILFSFSKCSGKVYDESGSTASTFGGMAGGPSRSRDHLHYTSDELFRKIFGEANAQRERQRREEEGASVEEVTPFDNDKPRLECKEVLYLPMLFFALRISSGVCLATRRARSTSST